MKEQTSQTQFFTVKVYDTAVENFSESFNSEVMGFLSNGEWAPYNIIWSPDSRWCTVFYSRIVNAGQLASSMMATGQGLS